jgi:cellulose synthase/poly-beta-1,6-N-acetylglucosamine synthase-like glycosyltransferase
MIVAPVSIDTTHPVSLINAYEQLDFLSLMGATIGGFGIRLPFLCNGANLAYEKEAFITVNGYTNNDHIASGDDHFLLEKFVETFPKKVRYLNSLDAGVTTQPQSSWKTLFSQRIRWASKTSGYTFWFSKMVGLLVFLANFITALLLLMIPFVFLGEYAFAKAYPKQLILFSLLFKYTVDLLLLARTASFFNRNSYLKWYPFIMLLYPFITTFIALKALTSSYEWKGRRFKQ